MCSSMRKAFLYIFSIHMDPDANATSRVWLSSMSCEQQQDWLFLNRRADAVNMHVNKHNKKRTDKFVNDNEWITHTHTRPVGCLKVERGLHGISCEQTQNDVLFGPFSYLFTSHGLWHPISISKLPHTPTDKLTTHTKWQHPTGIGCSGVSREKQWLNRQGLTGCSQYECIWTTSINQQPKEKRIKATSGITHTHQIANACSQCLRLGSVQQLCLALCMLCVEKKKNTKKKFTWMSFSLPLLKLTAELFWWT